MLVILTESLACNELPNYYMPCCFPLLQTVSPQFEISRRMWKASLSLWLVCWADMLSDFLRLFFSCKSMLTAWSMLLVLKPFTQQKGPEKFFFYIPESSSLRFPLKILEMFTLKFAFSQRKFCLCLLFKEWTPFVHVKAYEWHLILKSFRIQLSLLYNLIREKLKNFKMRTY